MRTISRMLAAALLSTLVPACSLDDKKDNLPPVTSASPGGGTYSGPMTVMLYAVDPWIPYGPHDPPAIYYSIDGVDPSIGGANTSFGQTPLGISLPLGTTVLKYFAVDDDHHAEDVQTQTYFIVP